MKKESMTLLITACVSISHYFKQVRVSLGFELDEYIAEVTIVNAVFADMGANENGELEEAHDELHDAITAAHTKSSLDKTVEIFWEKHGKRCEDRPAIKECLVLAVTAAYELVSFFERGKAVGLDPIEKPGLNEIYKMISNETGAPVGRIESAIAAMNGENEAFYWLERIKGK